MYFRVKAFYFVLILLSSFVFLFFSPNPAFSDPPTPKIETIVATVEGIVYVYEIGDEVLKDIPTLALGEFIRYRTDNVIEVRIGLREELCYVPEEIRGYAKERLKVNIPVLTRKKERRDYNTTRDLVAIGLVVKAGYEYSAHKIVVASPMKIRELMGQITEPAVSTVSEKGMPIQEETKKEVPPPPPPPPEKDLTPPTTDLTPPTTDEYYYVNPDNGDDGNDGSNNRPWKTITHALANVDTGVSTTIYLASGTYGTSSAGYNGETFPLLMINGITLQGVSPTERSSIIDQTGGGGTTAIILCTNISATMTSITFQNHSGTTAVIDISNCPNMTFNACTITNNQTMGFSINVNSNVTFNTCTITNNSSGNEGGIGCDSSTITLNTCVMSNNTTTASGGCIGMHNSTLTVNNSVFENNSAGTYGGAITWDGTSGSGTLSISNSVFNSNRATAALSEGGAIWLNYPGMNVTITGSTFNGNESADNGGGAIDLDGNMASTSITDCTIKNSRGCGIKRESVANQPTINGCRFFNNKRSGIGGTVFDHYYDAAVAPPIYYSAGGGGLPSMNTLSGCSGNVEASDPQITGKIYNSVTGENISSPVVAIYDATNNTQVGKTIDNPFTFNVDPGGYYFVLSKSGYSFPSQIKESTTSGDHGDIFTASSDPLTIDIPMDPYGWLVIEKTVNKKRVSIGEIVTYNIKIENKYWYSSVENVELIDELINGFKLVDNSTYVNGVKQTDITSQTSTTSLTFNIGTISANSTTNISYQVIVGSGITPGRYESTAVCQKVDTGEQRSNKSSIEIEVVEDVLFTRGTIIGKVFYDVNGNGVQDKKDERRGTMDEAGVPGVKIATEYGVVVETDMDGKYHIADVPPGRHLLKIMPDSFPEFLRELGGIEYTTDNPYYVKITEGLLAKVNFGLTTKELTVNSLQFTEKTPKFFIVALGEGTVRNLDTSGNIEMASSGRDNDFDDGLTVDGRLAFYLKGKILGKYLITASLDTDRQPGKKEDIKRLFTNLDPDKYYPVYGDASTIDYSATDTQDMAYVLIEWDKSYAKWGSFHTDMPMYSRTLSGGKIEYRSVKKTKFGEPFTEVDIFYATSRQKPTHDEFVGTGGSLYYLRHRDIVEGGEKIRVEIRDRLTKVPLDTIVLQEERDYEIDYDTGRILLRRPLNISNWAYKSSIVSNDILSGDRVYLIVDYEYYTRGGLSKEAVGGRAEQHIGNHIGVEGMYIEEERDDDPYQLYRGGATLRVNEETYIKGGYTHTKETQLGSDTSIDGGLSFIKLEDDYSSDKSGSAVDVKAETRLFKNTDVLLSYSRQDPYYSTTDSLSTAGTEKYIANVITQIKENIYAGIKHVTQRIQEGTVAGNTIAATDINITTGLLDWTPQSWDIRLEYQHQDVTRVLSGYTYMGFLPYYDNDFIAGRIGYSFNERLHIYIRGQDTVKGRADNQITFGSDIKIFKDTYINLAETLGNLGDSTLLGVTSQVREDTDVYANIEIGNHLDLGKFTRTSYGQTTQLTKDSRVYASHDYSTYQERLIRGNLLGYDKKLMDNLLFGLTYERSYIEDTSKTDTLDFINRDSGSVSLSYLDTDWLKLFSKLECRDDRGTSEKRRQWVTENEGQWYITQDITVLGRANYGWTEDRINEVTEAEFNEFGAGLAYRPVKWDKLNLLGKYSYITDLPPDVQMDFIEDMESRKHVVGLEGAYDICKYLGIVGKFGYRWMEEMVGERDWTDSEVYLYIGRINFHVINKWDIAAEYRVLTNNSIEDSKSGWLFELDREVYKYIRIGVGYNFTDYDDDLRDRDTWDAKGWFFRLTGEY